MCRTTKPLPVALYCIKENVNKIQEVTIVTIIMTVLYLCTTMKDCSTKVMCPCSKRKGEKHRTELELHCNKTKNSLHKIENFDMIAKSCK